MLTNCYTIPSFFFSLVFIFCRWKRDIFLSNGLQVFKYLAEYFFFVSVHLTLNIILSLILQILSQDDLNDQINNDLALFILLVFF